MILEVRLFAGLARYVREQKNGQSFTVELNEGDTVRDLLGLLRIPEQEAYVTMVNGTAALHSAQLCDGDRVGIFPAVGGG